MFDRGAADSSEPIVTAAIKQLSWASDRMGSTMGRTSGVRQAH
jgi:hypothetical protein